MPNAMEGKILFDVPCRASSCDVWYDCPTKYMWKLRFRVYPRRKQREYALDVGKFFHAFKEPEGAAKANLMWEEKRDSLTALISTGEDLDGRLAKVLDDTDQAYYVGRMMADLSSELSPDPEGCELLGAEIEHALDMPEVKVLIAGRLDQLMAYGDEVYVRDFKTSQHPPMTVTSSYGYSKACQIYRMLAEDFMARVLHMSATKLTGFRLLVVQKPTIKFCPNTKDGNKDGLFESKFHAFLNRCKDWYGKQEGTMVSSFSMRFGGLPLTPEILSELQAFTYRGRKSLTVEKGSALLEEYPRRSRSCCDPYGRMCPYLSLCTSSPATWDQILSEQFSVDPPEERRSSYDRVHGTSEVCA